METRNYTDTQVALAYGICEAVRKQSDKVDDVIFGQASMHNGAITLRAWNRDDLKDIVALQSIPFVELDVYKADAIVGDFCRAINEAKDNLRDEQIKQLEAQIARIKGEA